MPHAPIVTTAKTTAAGPRGALLRILRSNDFAVHLPLNATGLMGFPMFRKGGGRRRANGLSMRFDARGILVIQVSKMCLRLGRR